MLLNNYKKQRKIEMLYSIFGNAIMRKMCALCRNGNPAIEIAFITLLLPKLEVTGSWPAKYPVKIKNKII